MVRLSVVVPTYNEAANIVRFLEGLETELKGVDYEVVTVDDNSPDGTHGKILAYAKDHPRVHPVLRTTEKGLATAVIEGIRRSKGEYVAVMDSDFQHPARDVPRLLATAEKEGADCVVASRFAPGGSQEGFPLSRRVISWGAKQLAIWLLPQVRRFKIRDPQSGFFLVQRSKVALDALRPRGYKILLEILCRSRFDRVVEMGFGFENRREGESKLRIQTQWDYLLHVLGLAYDDATNRRVLFFLLVGATGAVVNLASLKFFMDFLYWEEWVEPDRVIFGQPFLIGALLGGLISREVSILWNFFWNERLTFSQERRHAHAGELRRLMRFHLVSITSAIAYLIVYYGLVHIGVGWGPAAIIGILAGFIFNYHGNVRWTYARRREPHGDA